MDATLQPIMGSVSRRTRRQWDAFYRSLEINTKKPRRSRDKFLKEKEEEPSSIKKSDSTDDDDDDDYKRNKNRNYRVHVAKNNKKGSKRRKVVVARTQFVIDEELDLISNLVDDSRFKEKYIHTRVTVDDNATSTLPLKFKFEDEQKQQDSSLADWEKEIKSLFLDLELGLWESEIGRLRSDDGSIKDVDESPPAGCCRCAHDSVLDEQIGIVYNFTDTQVEGSANCATTTTLESSVHSGGGGTVLDLIPVDVHKKMYPHQLEGLEFLWRNIVGDIRMDKLEERLPAKGGRGCIISHAPGTGKTRLTIVFLQTFMRLYPTCLPVIIAPLSMLNTWERELKKWNVDDIKFHILNRNKLSPQESSSAVSNNLLPENHKDYTRLVKLRLWMMGGGILGVSYRLFEKLAGEHYSNNNYNEEVKKILLELPGLLVMDEGHTARSEQSLMWNTLRKVKTKRRVMLSGTPFQNNFNELYNTFCLVNPNFVSRKRKLLVNDWLDSDDLKKLRLEMEPFVHTYQGSILEKNLPGLKDCLILLKPTDLQKELLGDISPSEKYLVQVHLTSIISVHPSLVSGRKEFSNHKRRMPEGLESDPDAGVKARFLIKLIQLSAGLGEKVLVFSEFIPPLRHIMSLVTRHLSWAEGREVMYLDGDIKMNERQRLIDSFNDERGRAKVMLASRGACSEGINLVGASRVVLLDVVWNPSVERQAICRAYRLGQEKVVHVYRLLIQEEVNKYARQLEKDRVSELLFSAPKTSRNTNEAAFVEEDKVLGAMIRHKSLGSIFHRIIPQPKDSDFTLTLLQSLTNSASS
ncbi:SNF2 domain-containing protein CLASSY 3 [Striga hermonthica]|uniref:SNF2 domain-containing protein CLASSY 3 n=1 Tax=Striga hermonthica TaxID=68872 RepID=A0A9N7NAB3_STRHE|nr:SNF2 domain-containing protein CLASSY 3 [Striga hermonthica]